MFQDTSPPDGAGETGQATTGRRPKRKLFTIEQANAALPLVRAIATDQSRSPAAATALATALSILRCRYALVVMRAIAEAEGALGVAEACPSCEGVLGEAEARRVRGVVASAIEAAFVVGYHAAQDDRTPRRPLGGAAERHRRRGAK